MKRFEKLSLSIMPDAEFLNQDGENSKKKKKKTNQKLKIWYGCKWTSLMAQW